jgi:TonB family protein
VPSYDASQIAAPDMQGISSAIEKMSTGSVAPLPVPLPQLPTQSQTATSSELPLPPPPDFARMAAALLEQAPAASGQVSDMDKPANWGEQVHLGEKQSAPQLALPPFEPKRLAPVSPAAPAMPVAPAPLARNIQGPAAAREPLHRPPLPQVQVQAESEITLKFWVRPDGMVSRVLPERKGDATLEAAAMRYLNGWRFAPLPPHEPQVEQWGTITVRFVPHAP